MMMYVTFTGVYKSITELSKPKTRPGFLPNTSFVFEISSAVFRYAVKVMLYLNHSRRHSWGAGPQPQVPCPPDKSCTLISLLRSVSIRRTASYG